MGQNQELSRRSILKGVIGVCAGAGVLSGAVFLVDSLAAGDLGEIQSARFRPHVDREWINVKDPQDLDAIRESINNARHAKIASYRPTSCPLILEMADGSTTQFAISPTGLTRSNISKRKPETIRQSITMISRNGKLRIIENCPFHQILKNRNRIAAPANV